MPSDSVSADSIWLAALRASGRSPKTLESYAAAVAMLRGWRSSDSDLTTLTRFEALAFTKHLGERYQPGGVALRIRSLRAMYGWLLAEQMVTSNPFARITITVPKEDKPTATDEQIESMLASAKRNRRDHALLVVAADTGCRRRELASVTLDCVNLTDGTIRFPISKSVVRTVPLSDRAIVSLGRWLRERGTKPGSLWACEDPYSLVNAACLRHSRGQLRAHSLRRSFAVRWLDRGGSELGLMRVAGWSSLDMIRVYTRAHADRLAHDEMRRLMA